MRGSAHAGIKREQEFGRGPVGAVNAEAPAEPVGFAAQFDAMALNPGLIVVAPRFGAAGRDLTAAFRLYEFDAPGIRKCFFRGIDDLHQMSMRAARRKLS